MTRKVKSRAGKLLALYVPKGEQSPGFLTDPGEPLQVGVFSRPGGYKAGKHRHVERPAPPVTRTQEALLVISGKIDVTVFDDDGNKCDKLRMKQGDLLVLLAGWHEAYVEYGAVFFEFKNGPHIGEADKERVVEDAAVPKP